MWTRWVGSPDFSQRLRAQLLWMCALALLSPSFPTIVTCQPRAFADVVPSAWTCSSLSSCYTFFSLGPTHPSASIPLPWEDGPAPSGLTRTSCDTLREPLPLLFAALTSFNHLDLCMTLTQFPLIDLSLLTFPIHLINFFSFSWRKSQK